MKLARARVIAARDGGPAVTRTEGRDGAGEITERLRARIVPRAVLEARQRAEAIVNEAKAEAEQILKRAEAEASDASLARQARARADALSLVVRQALELKKRRDELDEHLLERSIELARVLSERLLGEELELSPERVGALARQTLKEAAGARRAIVTAHPRDARIIEAGLNKAETPLEALVVDEDDSLKRGQIRVQTELGSVEADLAGQIERLATQLHKFLSDHGE